MKNKAINTLVLGVFIVFRFLNKAWISATSRGEVATTSEESKTMVVQKMVLSIPLHEKKMTFMTFHNSFARPNLDTLLGFFLFLPLTKQNKAKKHKQT